MRITLSLDDDVAVLLENVLKAEGLAVDEIVNRALRTGLLELTRPDRKQDRFPIQDADLGRCLIRNVDNVAQALAIGEEDSFRRFTPSSPS